MSHNGWIRAFFRLMFGLDDGSVSAGNCGYFEVRLSGEGLEVLKIYNINLAEGISIDSLKSHLVR